MADNKKVQKSENVDRRSSIEFLPKYFRSSSNAKFLDSTFDQLISEGTVDKVNGFIGRKTAKAYKIDDKYLDSVISDRLPYQLEPAAVIIDDLNNVNFFKDYIDYTNQLTSFNSNFKNHDVINRQEIYPWEPHIDWDKFINYREYYWLPSGPPTIAVRGQSKEIVSTYTVSLSEEGDNQAYLFTPDGLTRNPTLTLYRGQTYRFEIDCPGQPIAFSTTRSFAPSQSLIVATESGVATGGLFDVNAYDLVSFDAGSWTYNTAVATVDTGPFNLYDIWTDGVTSATLYVEKGTIEFKIPENSPDTMYYVSKNDINTSGLIKIYDITEASFIDVEKELIGKKTYTLQDGTELSNGMKISFLGEVTPTTYKPGRFYVEGVGSKIKLISEDELLAPGVFSSNSEIEFDNESFDTQGFDVNYAFPANKDYILINRGSTDGNLWSRYNRWFHRSVIEESARINNLQYELDQNSRAKRPIIEFNAGLKLFNFGFAAKKSVDLIDLTTLDVFGSSPVNGVETGVEGSIGYIVDGVSLVPGMRVLFAADTDILVRGRIFKVASVTHLGVKRLTLIEEPDSEPLDGQTVMPTRGKSAGTVFYYKNGDWIKAQEKISVNQEPLFDIFDSSGVSFSDTTKYTGSLFSGTKLFSYRVGNTYDTELKKNISYKNIENIGDIQFDFNLQTDRFQYQELSTIIDQSIDIGYLFNYEQAGTLVNGWCVANEESAQWIITQYDVKNTLKNFFPIDCYDNSGDLPDLKIKVIVNSRKKSLLDYEIYRQDSVAYIRFFEDLKTGDVLLIKTWSSAAKNDLRYYEFPSNLEINPLNENLETVTLGQVSDHIATISDNAEGFVGTAIGINNLRDLGNVSKFGRKILQHAGSLLPVIYHTTSRENNVILSLKYAGLEYIKFKKNFIKTISEYGFDGEIDVHLDLVLSKMFKDNSKTMPFYLSDMLGYRANRVFQQIVIDDSITDYPLLFDFNLSTLSDKSVLVYVNGNQLLFNKDYEFLNDNFVRVFNLKEGDELKIVQYESTDACYVPATPTKLGIYPKFEPKIFIDNTYQNPTKVIQGHDGSITVAYNDFRDNLILELEKRIFNNIKVEYSHYLKNIIPGYYRETELTSSQIDSVLAQDFLIWNREINRDFTKNSEFNKDNPWTYNYRSFTAADGDTQIPGFWRAVYKFAYDTDRPHTHPWEILGFSIKPSWWEKEYGPAPYTKDNLVLWKDIAEGKIKDSKIPRYDLTVARPSILMHLPVNSAGKLVDPLTSGFVKNFYSTYISESFQFGDSYIVETAWRKSSHYPFALMTALCLLSPAKMFSLVYDVSRQIRRPNGQLVYKTVNGDRRFSSKWLEYPSTVADTERRFASGLINYVFDYSISKSLLSIDKLKDDLSRLTVKISSKLEGYTTEEKFRLILDSRTPLNEGNVFIPYENYQIILNTSSPVDRVSYSGVIIERANNGYVINGYSTEVPIFKYHKVYQVSSDPQVNVGGISAPYVLWSPEKYYSKGSIVKFGESFFQTNVEHESLSTFEEKYFTVLRSLPIVGGRDIIMRTKFQKSISELYYGSVLYTIQEVVDFLLGYGKYLESQGFKFERYNENLETVVNWKTSAKEFAFWTTQNWNNNSAITVSPSANEINFSRNYVVVNDIYSSFYDYTVLKQDGNILEPKFINSDRSFSKFSLSPFDTSDGIYFISLDLVSKEHVLVLDDNTIFNDTIYDRVTGYRQERIRAVGYKTSDWQGDFLIPGFVYDRVTVKNWEPWTDYFIGESVKYKEFYYSAIGNIPGKLDFDPNDWNRLTSKPVSKLIPNWEYRANQFADFYDLDTDSFDTEQQKFAQHLIGYQPRKYLENIINDDVAQYKFYQGMIREKGTKNSINKLFDALNYSQSDSIEFHEQWALRLGQYGASDGFDEIEIPLNENKFRLNPQPIEFVNELNSEATDLVYRVLPSQVSVKPENYNHRPFPVISSPKQFLPTAGYVSLDDIDHTLFDVSEIITMDLNSLAEGDYIWISKARPDWDIKRFTRSNLDIVGLVIFGPDSTPTVSEQTLQIYFNRPFDLSLTIFDYVAFKSDTELNGIYQITNVTDNYILVSFDKSLSQKALDNILKESQFIFYEFKKWRFKTIDDRSIQDTKFKDNELVWIDNTGSDWAVWKFDPSFDRRDLEFEENQFSRNFAVSEDNLNLAVVNSNTISYFARSLPTDPWVGIDRLTVFDQGMPYRNISSFSFGDSISLSRDGSMLLVGVPEADDISGDSSSAENEGIAILYKKELSGLYSVSKTYTSRDRIAQSRFGFKVKILSDSSVISASRGTINVAPAQIFRFNSDSEDILYSADLGNVEIQDMAVSEKFITVALSNDRVKVFDYTLTEIQEITYTITDIKFANSIDMDDAGNYLMVGAPKFSETFIEQGIVFVYRLVDGAFELTQTIKSPVPQNSENFGHIVRVFKDTQVAILGRGGKLTYDTLFDNNATTFDLKSTRVVDESSFTGTVRVFDRYDSKFSYSVDLEPLVLTDNEIETLGAGYATQIEVVNNHIYINDPRSNFGRLYEFSGLTTAWYKHRYPSKLVDLTAIKSVFLYNTETDEIVENLDFIDPIRGKIPGIADQEISFKTIFDPAIYSIGDDRVTVESQMPWLEKNVGKLWWNIDSTRFVDPYQRDILFKTNIYNSLFPDTNIEVLEWIESEYLPSERDLIADTEEGLALNISGKSKYGDSIYSIKKKYDNVSKKFKNYYYFWVINPTVVPPLVDRNISANDVRKYIENPADMGLRYVNFLEDNQLSLINCTDLLVGKKIALNIRIWTIKNKTANIHSHYQIISETDNLKVINPYIEQKWIDSLVGYDIFGNDVPDNKLPEKLKYGILNRPRQSMFINRVEALKQFVERANAVLINTLLVDDFDYSDLNTKEEKPIEASGEYDIEIDSYEQLRFVNVIGTKQPLLEPVISQGKIIRVIINDPGKNYRLPPKITVDGSGNGAELQAVINSTGQIVDVIVVKSGQNYNQTTFVRARPFSVLVNVDETAADKWSIYRYYNFSWNRDRTQIFDTTKYWKSVDWYASGYNQFTKIDHVVDFTYQIAFEDISVGDTVKVNNQGAGGWMILEKVSETDSFDLSVDYRTVGRQNGTIQFDSTLYSFKNSRVGFDGPIYDNDGYDEIPKEEIRIILNVIKNNIFVDQLLPEYKKLFFSSLRYVFSEQKSVDWAFKTSFITGKHNLGDLDQPVNFKNNKVDNYQDYIEEIKPYSTKIKEFVSAYEKVEKTQSKITDFDLPPYYDNIRRTIEVERATVSNGFLTTTSNVVNEAPYADWYDNIGYSVSSIEVVDGGQGYLTAPTINIVGPSTTIASAKAYLSEGKIIRIEMESTGSGYIDTPIIEITGAISDEGYHATLVPILSSGMVRTNLIGVKFDRVSSVNHFVNIKVTENFIGTGSRISYDLRWPINIEVNKTVVKIFNEEALPTDYYLENVKDESQGYLRYFGRLTFENPPENFSSIDIVYEKDPNLLSAADRIQHYYAPTSGMLGKDFGQLMQGVDYGGVEVLGLSFDIGSGWDGLPWSITGWDNFDETFTDFIIKTDGTTSAWTLPYVPDIGEEINVYLNGVRLDDPNFSIIKPLIDQIENIKNQISNLEQEIIGVESDFNSAGSQINSLTAQIDSTTQQLDNTAAQLIADPNNAILLAQYNSLLSLITDLTQQLNQKITEYNQLNVQLTSLNTQLTTAKNQLVNANNNLSNAPALKNPNAVMQTFIGNGVSNGPITIPDIADFIGDFTPNNIIDTVIFRKSSSDGSFRPDDSVIDLDLSGGLLSYSSALGIAADDIVVDGDGFVTVHTSHGPEELVTGQVLDSVDIAVYDKATNKKPLIAVDQYMIDTDREFSISQPLNSDTAVMVKLDDRIITQGVDYSLDYRNGRVGLTVEDITEYQLITIVSFGKNGISLLDIGTLISDGEQIDFILDVDGDLTYSIFVTVDGQEAGFTTFVNEYNKLGFRFTDPAEEGKVIEYIITEGEEISFSRLQKYSTVTDATSLAFTLPYAPVYKNPLATNIVVDLDGKILKPNRSFYFTYDGSSRLFFINEIEVPYNSVTVTDFKVFVNGIEKFFSLDFDWDPAQNLMRFRQDVLVAGDRIIFNLLNTGDYHVDFQNDNYILVLNDQPEVNKNLTVSTFSNHDILSIERTVSVIRSQTGISIGNPYYFTYNLLRTGIIELTYRVRNINAVWVVKNGVWLTPNRDFILDESGSKIKINTELVVIDTDQIEVILFDIGISSNSYGYKMFKDILNRSNYLRINDNNSTVLIKPLKYNDRNIEVFDASRLPTPTTKVPGIIFIDGERIEYFSKNQNVLSRLRRGTAGTGIKDEYPIDTLVREFSSSQNIPYNDETITNIHIANGNSNIVPLNFVPNVIVSTKNSTSWYRETIPLNYGQCDEIEVFAAGRRLRKQPMYKWSPLAGPDSPIGDINLEAEFAVDGESSQILLNFVPLEGTKIIVQKKIGYLWKTQGESLRESTSSQAIFVRLTAADDPDTPVDKYKQQIIGAISPNALLVEDGSGPITDEDGDPLEVE